jgi:hypothetical protein
MLYSPAASLAFAHYPKTAGHSLVSWFQETFPDARFVEPPQVYTISHLPVRESLDRLGLLGEPPRPSGWQRLTSWLVAPPAAGGLRIIGVLRDPFEMLVSLFEYWRNFAFAQPPQPLLIRTARERTFREFLALAVGTEPVQNYRDFFDVGGPAWQRTRLLDFTSLEPALAAVCREFAVPHPRTPLARRNTGPRPGRELGPYRDQAGSLEDDVRRHFNWYHASGRQLAVRG